MKTSKVIFLMFITLSSLLLAQKEGYTITKAKPFFDQEHLKTDETLKWGYLSVPENWINPSNNIKIAFTVLKKKKKSSQEPLLYIEGGPGQSGVGAFGFFKDHPLREYSDIILVDARGVGNSLPKLCPELGTEIFKILSSNESTISDEKNRAFAAMNCKNELIKKGIDPANYNSVNIANDLHALKLALHYDKWNVLGVSYGTYISQVYANTYPEDFNKMILDSPVDNISQYYNKINEHYVDKLDILFLKCKQDPIADKKFPNLEKTYYEVIADLSKNPLTVNVPKDLLEKGSFTFNSEDFKLVIHQSLYSKQLIELLPVIITLFHDRDAATLSSIVRMFGGVFSALDFGTYYSMLLNDTLPYNSIKYFDKDAAKFSKLKGGLSFYRSDFLLNSQWNNKQVPQYILDYAKMSKIPTKILAGEFDPITPVSNAQSLTSLLNAELVIFKNEGHGLIFNKKGGDLVKNFISDKPFTKANSAQFVDFGKVHFITNIHVNAGIPNMGMLLLGNFDILKLAPIIIACAVLLTCFVYFSFIFFRKRNVEKLTVKFFYSILIINCMIGMLSIGGFMYAMIRTNDINYFLCAFGILDKFGYLFVLLKIYLVLSCVSLISFLGLYKLLQHKIVIISVLFSFMLLLFYFYHLNFFN